MKKICFVLAVMAMGLVACNKESAPLSSSPKHEELLGNGLKYIEIAISQEKATDAETKAAISDNVKLSFGVGDQIAVLATKDATTTVATLTYVSYDDVKKEVVFGGTIDEEATIGNYAYYPASIATTTELTINWPTAVDGAKVQVPMVAYLNTDSNKATFKYLGAIAKIATSNTPAGATKLKFTAASNITGTYTVSDFTTGTPTLTPSGDLTGKTITATISGDNTYYIPLPAGTYAGFQFAMINGDDTYYYKQKTAKSETSLTLARKEIANLKTLTYDVDEIAEWWHVSLINGWNIGYDRYIKTGANTYQLTVFNPSADEYWDLKDADGNKWCVSGDAGAWSGPVTQTGDTFHRTGATDKTFWVTLTKDGSSWSYNSGNYGDNSPCNWSASGDPVKFSTNMDIEGDGSDWDTITLTKYNYDANYGYKYEGLVIPDNNEYEFKFILNGTWCGNSSSGITLTDAVPYAQGTWAGSNNMKFRLTAGVYNIYIDVDQINFMFVRAADTPSGLEDMTLSSEYNI